MNTSKRNSYTPQKRKPVPSLYPEAPPVPALPQSLAPHEIPLPPSPMITPVESEFDDQATQSDYSDSSIPVPPLDPPSRGPSIDGTAEDDEFLNESLELQWERPSPPARKLADSDPLHESALQLQT